MIKQAITLVKKGLQSYRFLRSSVQKVEVSTSSLLSLFNFQLVLKCQISEIKAHDSSMFSSYMSVSVWLIALICWWVISQIQIILCPWQDLSDSIFFNNTEVCIRYFHYLRSRMKYCKTYPTRYSIHVLLLCSY